MEKTEKEAEAEKTEKEYTEDKMVLKIMREGEMEDIVFPTNALLS